MSRDIDAIIDKLFEEDRKFLKKIINRNKRVATILMLAGIVLNAGALLSIIFIAFSKLEPMQTLTYTAYALFIALFGSFISRQGTMMLHSTANLLNPGRGRYKCFSKLKCPKCGFVETREKQSDEYVGMVTETMCGVCGEKMIIAGIYAQPEREVKTIGYPLLPTPGQTTITQIKAAMLDILTPFKIAFRIKRNSLKESNTKN
ncbi:MAG: hypothetical protein NDP22_04480 [Crenarchaeota archaeon]|nr:hypothetical protein [Thermoproteota archaeon]